VDVYRPRERGRRRKMPLLRFETLRRDRTLAGSKRVGRDSQVDGRARFQENARALLAPTDRTKARRFLAATFGTQNIVVPTNFRPSEEEENKKPN
jgi:hypothetical protein